MVNNMKVKYLMCGLMLTLGLATGPVNADKKEYRSPETVEGAVTVSVQQAKEFFDQGVTFLDVRNPRLYANGHVPGTYHLDYKYNFDEEKLASVAEKNQPLVIYCSGVKCSRSYRASEKALEWGYTKVYYFRGGIVEWKKAGYPIEKSDSAEK